MTGFRGHSLASSPPLPRSWVAVSLLVLLVFLGGLGLIGSSAPQPAAQAEAGLPAPSSALSAAPAAPLLPVPREGIAFETARNGDVPGVKPGDIYLMEADGSNQINLSQNPAYDGQPAFSPDGQRIAFISDRDGNRELYLMHADGSGQSRLTYTPEEGAEPAWSPDGTRIAYVRLVPDDQQRFHRKLYEISDISGSLSQLFADVRGTQWYGPTWSPDGTRLAFQVRSGGMPWPGNTGTAYDIYS